MSTIAISNSETMLLTAGYENFSEERWFSSISSPPDSKDLAKGYQEILGANFTQCIRQPQKGEFALVAQRSPTMREHIRGGLQELADADNSFALFCRFLAIVGGSATLGHFAGLLGTLSGVLMGLIIFIRSTKWHQRPTHAAEKWQRG